MPLRMIISILKVQSRMLAATHLPRAAIDGMNEPLLIRGVRGTGRVLSGSNGTYGFKL